MNNDNTKLVSVVIPAYNEELSVKKAAEAVSKVMEENNINYEIVFVDDGSKDKTWSFIEDEHKANAKVRGISFSRNFGKEAAIFAGLAQAAGDCVVVMDCDLQHPPQKIPEMVALWQEGYQVVEGVKTQRGKESAGHKAAAGFFYKLMSDATKSDMSGTSDFKLLDRRAVDVLIALREKNTFFRALSSWVGFKSVRMEYEVQPRLEGESKWSLKSLTKYAINNLTSFSTLPLKLVTYLGVAVLIISLVFGIIALCQKAAGVALGGFTTVILLQLIIGSILMICLGIIGYYLGKIYEEVKDRPRYIIGEKTEK